MVGKVFGDCESGDGEDLFFVHEAHGFVAEVIGVIHGFDAGFSGVERARFTGVMNRDALAGAGGFFNGSAEFGFGVLVGRDEMAVDERVAAGFVHFDEIGTFFDLLADSRDDLIGVIRVVRIRENVLGRIEMVGVFVAAENVDGIAAHAHPWTRNFAAIDGVAHGGVGRTSAFRAHVALGGEAGHQVGACGEGRGDGALGDGFFDGLQIFGARMKEKMNVSIDEAWQESGVAEVHDFSALRMLHGGTDFDDAVALDKDFSRRDYFAGFNLEEARGVQNNDVLRRRRCGLRGSG